MSDERPAANLESPLPSSMPAGVGTAVFCSGTACEGSSPLAALELLRNEHPVELNATNMPRFDVPCRRSGFWGVIPVVAGGSGGVELTARLRLANGRCVRRELGRIAIDQSNDPRARPERESDGEGLVAICMATFDPEPKLLRAQIDSLRRQLDTRWTCVISDDHSSKQRYDELLEIVGDDPRFLVSRAARRMGFYRNFERALRMAPDEAQLIALCDQDDVWHPEKLSVLRRSIGSSVLVFSDSRVVDHDGAVLRETLWRGRANNWTNLASLLFANTVTGAAALFRREIAELALPFPDCPGNEFHDHWIALVALASGEISYVDAPLYDYVQHRQAVLGSSRPVLAGPEPTRPRRRWRVAPRMRVLRAAYFFGWIPTEVRARTLLLRCSDTLTHQKRRSLERHLRAPSSLSAFAWLVLRPLRALFGHNETLGAEWDLAPGICWRALAGLIARIPRWPERWLLDTRFPDAAYFEQRGLSRWRSRVYDQQL
ncbi:MAG: glycosyltransferase [Solirubrobacterales bacterium]|nr:glycosyltransferase [Solirubrobacterales bacterium]